MTADQKNIKILHQELVNVIENIRSMQERIVQIEGALANLSADQANTKSLIGHVLGRGRGSTVHGDSN
jgi:hypothetical protein